MCVQASLLEGTEEHEEEEERGRRKHAPSSCVRNHPTSWRVSLFHEKGLPGSGRCSPAEDTRPLDVRVSASTGFTQ